MEVEELTRGQQNNEKKRNSITSFRLPEDLGTPQVTIGTSRRLDIRQGQLVEEEGWGNGDSDGIWLPFRCSGGEPISVETGTATEHGIKKLGGLELKVVERGKEKKRKEKKKGGGSGRRGRKAERSREQQTEPREGYCCCYSIPLNF
jgi:hypothetical protein